MTLACKKCNSRDTFVCGAKDLSAKTGNQVFVSGATCGIVADPVLIFTLLGVLAKAATALLDYLGTRAKNNPPVFVCKACGWWERIPDSGSA